MEINFNDWAFHELALELKAMTLTEMLTKYQQLGKDMEEIAKDFFDITKEEKEKKESEYNKVHKEQVFVAVRIAEKSIGN